MLVVFVHGWSVRNTDTYGDLPLWLAEKTGADGKPFDVGNIFLGRYISFDDAITVDDISRAFEQAVQEVLGDKIRGGERFACITHSTGAPVIRNWIEHCHRDRLEDCPMSHLIMLAPANHGSALAQLGKGRLSRMQSFFQGTEPGARVLDWLELGSELSWQLNYSWLDYDSVPRGVYPFVLTGQRIDRKLYDALNAYTGEAGSDGVVRVAAANMNYGFLRIVQQAGNVAVAEHRHTRPTAFGVLPGLAHSGAEMGIVRSVGVATADSHPTAAWVLKCLRVANTSQYRKLQTELDNLTDQTQEAERVERTRGLFSRTFRTSRYSMIVFRMLDDRGQELSDYELYVTAGPAYSEQDVPPGFFLDRQRNQRHPGKLTYYVDYDVLRDGLARQRAQGKIGFRIVARPDDASGRRLVYYRLLEYRTTFEDLSAVLSPNETLMVEFVLQRHVDHTVFSLTDDLTPGNIDPTPSGRPVTWQQPLRSPPE